MELIKNKISSENVRNILEKMHYYHKNSEKVEFKMKPQAPLTNMEGRWIQSTKEAYDATGRGNVEWDDFTSTAIAPLMISYTI